MSAETSNPTKAAEMIFYTDTIKSERQLDEIRIMCECWKVEHGRLQSFYDTNNLAKLSGLILIQGVIYSSL